MDIKKLQELAGITPNKQKLDENFAGAVAGAVAGKAVDKAFDESDSNPLGAQDGNEISMFGDEVGYDESMSEQCPQAAGSVEPYASNCMVGDSDQHGAEEVIVLDLGEDEDEEEFSGDEFGYEADLEHGDSLGDLDDAEIDAPMPQMDYSDEIPAAPSNDAMIDTSTMIANIMAAQDSGLSSAKVEYPADKLIDMSPDMLSRIHSKVLGNSIDEEDDHWGQEDGYQAMSDNGDGETRAKNGWQGGEGFPTGQANNAVSHIGNTGGDFKDNPLRNPDPVSVEESKSEDCSACKGTGRKRVADGFGDTESIDCKGCDGTGKRSSTNESIESISSRLSEAYDAFCEEYEAELEENFGSMRFSGQSSMRGRGRGLSSVRGHLSKQKKRAEGGETPPPSGGREMADDDFEAEFEKEFGEMPMFLKTQAESVDDADIDENLGSMRFNGQSSMRGRGRGLSAVRGSLEKQKKRKAKDATAAEKPVDEGEIDDYISAKNPAAFGLDDQEIDHNYHDHEISDIPRGDVEIDDLSYDDMEYGSDGEFDTDMNGSEADWNPYTQAPMGDDEIGYDGDRDIERLIHGEEEVEEEDGYWNNRKKADKFDKERQRRKASSPKRDYGDSGTRFVDQKEKEDAAIAEMKRLAGL